MSCLLPSFPSAQHLEQYARPRYERNGETSATTIPRSALALIKIRGGAQDAQKVHEKSLEALMLLAASAGAGAARSAMSWPNAACEQHAMFEPTIAKAGVKRRRNCRMEIDSWLDSAPKIRGHSPSVESRVNSRFSVRSAAWAATFRQSQR